MTSSNGGSGSRIGALAGFSLGAFVGSAFGVAGFGTAIAGTLPVGIFGAWLGYRHGASVISVVERIIELNSSQLKRNVKITVREALETLLPDTPNEEQRKDSSSANDVPVRLIAVQLGLAGLKPSMIRIRASDDWSIGYVWGFEAAFVEWRGGGPDVDGFASMAMMFIMLYGQEDGAKFCGRALRLQEKYHPSNGERSHPFPRGLMAGWRDAIDWLTSQEEKAPLRWFEHLNLD